MTSADPTQERLHELITRGFQFLHPTAADGSIQAVVGVRVHDDVIDLVQLHAENDVSATRMPVDEADIMAPKTVLWQIQGQVADVLDEVLSLPDGPNPAADGAAGCWVPVKPGEARWLRASA